jgi:multidrug efflux pump subunit AcrA (membrane-fusion protein)
LVFPDTDDPSAAFRSELTIEAEAIREESLPGQVTAIAPSADPQGRLFSVEVTLKNQDGRLKAGTIGTVQLMRAMTRMPRPYRSSRSRPL